MIRAGSFLIENKEWMDLSEYVYASFEVDSDDRIVQVNLIGRDQETYRFAGSTACAVYRTLALTSERMYTREELA